MTAAGTDDTAWRHTGGTPVRIRSIFGGYYGQPDPHRTAITERNLAAIWANYAALGETRLIYTNTVSVLEEPEVGSLSDAHVRRIATNGLTGW